MSVWVVLRYTTSVLKAVRSSRKFVSWIDKAKSPKTQYTKAESRIEFDFEVSYNPKNNCN